MVEKIDCGIHGLVQAFRIDLDRYACEACWRAKHPSAIITRHNCGLEDRWPRVGERYAQKDGETHEIVRVLLCAGGEYWDELEVWAEQV